MGLATADDDQISVYADNHRAVLITHDKEAIRRRRKNTFGRHVYLHCDDIDAVETIAKHLADVVLMITTRDAIVLKVAKDGVGSYPNRWQ